MTYTEFVRAFPDNTACLDYLRDKYFPAGSECPKCKRETRFHRITGRSAYSCQYCGHHVYPTAGTIFEKSTVSLHLWFYAIFLMSSTRCGMAAKQLEREIGVTYKTAHRMFKLIRSMLSEDDDEDMLTGEVEMDETAYGGKPRAGEVAKYSDHNLRQAGARWGAENKTTVVGMVERGGRVRAYVVPDRGQRTLGRHARRMIDPASILYTDEWGPYHGIRAQFAEHHTIHHKDKVYVDGLVHTNTVEGYFGLIKGGIRGVYRSVSRKWLQSYLDEYSFRYNHRHTINSRPMFWNFLDQVTGGQPAA